MVVKAPYNRIAKDKVTLSLRKPLYKPKNGVLSGIERAGNRCNPLEIKLTVLGVRPKLALQPQRKMTSGLAGWLWVKILFAKMPGRKSNKYGAIALR